MKTSEHLTALIENTKHQQHLHVMETGRYNPALVEVEDKLHRMRFSARSRERHPHGLRGPSYFWVARLWSRLNPAT